MSNVKELVDLLSVDRLEKYATWYKLMCCLYSLDQKELAREFSKKSTNYNDKFFEEVWSYISKKEHPYTVNSLVYWAHIDSKLTSLKL